MWKEINSESDLPPENMYVLAKLNKTNWISDDPNVTVKVLACRKGISKAEREEMRGTDKDYLCSKPVITDTYCISGLRSDTECFEDEHSCNPVPWAWREFGHHTYAGNEVTHWMYIPPIEKRSK